MTAKTEIQKPKRTKIEIKRERVKVQAEITRRQCRASFYKFFLYFWDTIVPDPLVNNWHIKFICDELQEIAERVIKREKSLYDTIFNIPPGTSKSTLVTIMWPAWIWLRDPGIRIINGSYSQDVAMEHAVKTRDVLQSLKFLELYGEEIQFKSDQNNKTRYENTAHGTRTSCGVGGTITSKHAHILIMDDPINPKQSHSDVLREAAIKWMDGTFSTRKVDKIVSTTVLVMQRLHEMDPTGYLLHKSKDKGKKIKHICLPGEVTKDVRPKTLRIRYKKGILDNRRMPREVLEDMKIDLGDDYAGQVLQSPMAPGGNIIKREWINTYTELPMRDPFSVIQSWDTAYKKDEQNAYQCCGTWLEYQNGYYLDHVFCEKLTYPELKQQVIALDSKKYAGFRPGETLIEEKASGIPTVQELENDTTINFVKIIPDMDKIQRAHAASPTFKARNVYIRGNASWTALVIEQLTMFPNCRILDIMDMVSQYIIYIRQHKTINLSQLKGGSKSKITKGYRYG